MKIGMSIILCCLITSFLYAGEKIRFAPLPMQDKKVLYETFYPMIQYLEKILHRKVQFVFLKNYQDIIKNFQEGKIDLAYLGPLPYVELTQNFTSAKPLVTFKNETGHVSYTCSLVTSLATKAKNKVALTQPYSTCGYLSVNAMLHQKLHLFDFKYLGRHDLVALSVLEGKYNLGGVKTSIYHKYYHLGLQEVQRTKPLPMFALVANTKTLSQTTTFSIKNALMSIPQTILSTWGTLCKYGVEEIDDTAYIPVRQMLKGVKIPLQGTL